MLHAKFGPDREYAHAAGFAAAWGWLRLLVKILGNYVYVFSLARSNNLAEKLTPWLSPWLHNYAASPCKLTTKTPQVETGPRRNDILKIAQTIRPKIATAFIQKTFEFCLLIWQIYCDHPSHTLIHWMITEQDELPCIRSDLLDLTAWRCHCAGTMVE